MAHLEDVAPLSTGGNEVLRLSDIDVGTLRNIQQVSPLNFRVLNPEVVPEKNFEILYSIEEKIR